MPEARDDKPQPRQDRVKRTYYDVLDLDRDASPEEIKTAYYALAREHHPDLADDDPEVAKQFAVIGDAYRVLSDPQRRHQYDRTLPQKSYPLRHPTPAKIWREATDVVLIRSDRFGPLNQSMQAAVPLALDEDLLVLTVPGSERHLAGHMETAANRNAILNALELVSGQRLDFRIIDGSTVEDWETLKAGEVKARKKMAGGRERETTPAGPASRPGEGVWDELIQRMHRRYQELPKRQYPQSKARYLREVLGWVARAEEDARYQSDLDEEAYGRSLARAIERLAAMVDVPPVLVAMQLDILKRAGEV